MADVLREGAKWLTGQMQDHASGTAVYCRSTEEPIEIAVTRGETAFRTQDLSGMSILIRSIDFLFAAADLDFGHGPAEPRDGDTIEIEGRRYVVRQAVSGEAAWRYSGPHGDRLRVHTREHDHP